MNNKRIEIATSFLLVFTLMCSCLLLCGCFGDAWDDFWNNFPDQSFSAQWKTTEDGFSYYVDDEIGLCIMRFPKQDEIIIPEYIDGMRVAQLGCKTEPSLGHDGNFGVSSSVKKLTIQHKMSFFCDDFPYLETLAFVDCWYEYADILSRDPNTLTVYTWNYTHSGIVPIHPNVELLRGNKDINLKTLDVSTIEIPQCVTVIENGVFDGIENVTIKTSYETKPEGWQDGWNSGLEVEWGVTFD